MSRTLVLLAHPDLASSRVNSALADAVRDQPGVTVRDLATVRGPNGFDAAAEQRMLLRHDTVVLQFPWYWYSVPGILKEWMDQVLTHGFAYGSGCRSSRPPAARASPTDPVATTASRWPS
jgi:putative NADPH-quinone reductase